MNDTIKPWLIIASAPVCGTETYYTAYSIKNPLDEDDFPYSAIIDELWDNYSYLLHLETDEECEQEYENWSCDCSFHSEEMDLKNYNPDDYPIIYDERK